MTRRSWLILGVVWLISLVTVGTAQAPAWRPLPEPKVLFGDDVGFRVEGMPGRGAYRSHRDQGEWELGRGAGRGAEADQVTPTLSSGSFAATLPQRSASPRSRPQVHPGRRSRTRRMPCLQSREQRSIPGSAHRGSPASTSEPVDPEPLTVRAAH